MSESRKLIEAVAQHDPACGYEHANTDHNKGYRGCPGDVDEDCDCSMKTLLDHVLNLEDNLREAEASDIESTRMFRSARDRADQLKRDVEETVRVALRTALEEVRRGGTSVDAERLGLTAARVFQRNKQVDPSLIAEKLPGPCDECDWTFGCFTGTRPCIKKPLP